MPDEPRPSVVHHIRPCWRISAIQAAGLFAGMTVAVLALYAASAASGASAHGSNDPDQRGLTPERSAADWKAFGAIATFLEVAAQSSPTFTATPTATATLVPAPTATAPAPAPTPAAPVLRQQAPAPPAEPTLAPAPAPAAPWGLDTSPMDAYSQALFDATNRRRIDNGLPPLRVNGWLIGIARIRSQDMADHNYFAHVSPITGDNAFTLMDKHGVPYGWAGENLAKNNYPSSDAVSVAENALWNSPPHRENILNPNYTHMGIALVVDGSGMKYFTIIFTGPL
jgi:uncharacterized protein YkwD